MDEAPTIDPESLRGHAKWVKDKELKFIIDVYKRQALCSAYDSLPERVPG